MAKNKKSKHQEELENLSLPASEVPVLEAPVLKVGANATVYIDDYATLPKRFEDMSIRELLDMSEAGMVLGKRYENLAIAEGNQYFPQKSKYNELYNKIIAVLTDKLEYYLR